MLKVVGAINDKIPGDTLKAIFTLTRTPNLTRKTNHTNLSQNRNNTMNASFGELITPAPP